MKLWKICILQAVTNGEEDDMETISLLRDLSLLIGIWVAIYGIDSWRREHKGKREIELAEDVLALFYEARDAIKYMRFPFSPSGECVDIQKADAESDTEWQARRNASIAFKRYDERKDMFNRIHAMRYRFMAQVGPVEAAPFEDLKKIANEVLVAARMLAQLWPRNYFRTNEQYQQHTKQVEKYQAVLWEGMGGDDPINTRLDSIIETMEKTCRNLIMGKGTLYAFLNRPLWRSQKCSQPTDSQGT
jgi:hypothetical protein